MMHLLLFKMEFDGEEKKKVPISINIYDENAHFSSREILRVASHLLEKYAEKYQFDLQSLKTILQNMQNSSSLPHWDLWNHSLSMASGGQARKRLEEYRFSE